MGLSLLCSQFVCVSLDFYPSDCLFLVKSVQNCFFSPPCLGFNSPCTVQVTGHCWPRTIRQGQVVLLLDCFCPILTTNTVSTAVESFMSDYLTLHYIGLHYIRLHWITLQPILSLRLYSLGTKHQTRTTITT